ncbi:trypsin-like peptidase domain-containing protein [Candidatus Poribacteria bacterium]|nr:trypsin-like peptidase domain-containing protein [Candidatus Poribacteria bacterium]
MRHYIRFLFNCLVLGILLLPLNLQVNAQEISEKDGESKFIDKVGESTVQLVKGNNSLVIGYGFFVERDKIATNFQVVANLINGPIFVRYGQQETTWTVEGVAAFDIKNEIVILKIAGIGTPLTFGNSDTLNIGDNVYVVGYHNPQEKFEGTVGTVEHIRKNDNWIQTTIQTYMKNSGAPVLNSKGEVIGIHMGSFLDTTPQVIPKKLGEDKPYNTYPSNALKPLLSVSTSSEPLEEWMKREPVRAYNHYKLGQMYYYSGFYGRASDQFDISVKLNPEHFETYIYRAQSNIFQEQTKKPISD